MFSFQSDRIDFAHKIDHPSNPHEEYAKHMHYFNELIYIVRGDVTYTVESETHKLNKGDIVFISSGKYHFAEVSEKVPYERFVLKFQSDVVPDYLLSRFSTERPFFSNTKLLSYNFQNLEEYYNHYSGEDVETLFLSELLNILVRLSNNPTHLDVEQNEFVSSVISYIDDNIQKKISLESLADHFSFSKSYMSNEFHKYMKTPIMHYIKTKKIFAAHALIQQGKNKTEVAELLGFEDYSTFYRSYVKIMGRSPSGRQ